MSFVVSLNKVNFNFTSFKVCLKQHYVGVPCNKTVENENSRFLHCDVRCYVLHANNKQNSARYNSVTSGKCLEANMAV